MLKLKYSTTLFYARLRPIVPNIGGRAYLIDSRYVFVDGQKVYEFSERNYFRNSQNTAFA